MLTKKSFQDAPHVELTGQQAWVHTLEQTVQSLLAGERPIITASLLPDYPPRVDPRLHFIKYGNKIELSWQSSPPSQRLLYASITDFCTGYAWTAHNSRKIVTMDQILKGAKLFAYATEHDSFEFTTYKNDVLAMVPSRTPKKPRYELTLRNIPSKKAHWPFLTTTHSCEFKNTIVGARNTDVFCAHEIAAYFGYMRSVYRQTPVPYQASPFFLPSQNLVNFSHKVSSLKYEDRFLNLAEREMLLWEFARQKKSFIKADRTSLSRYPW